MFGVWVCPAWEEQAGVVVAILSVLLGHLQVLGQQPVIYTKDTFPDQYFNFLKFPTWFNLDVLSWIGYECTSNGESTPFFATFTCYSVMPLLGMLPTLYGLQAFARSRRRAYVQRKRAASAGQASLMSVDMQRSAGVELSANPMYNAMYYSEIDKDREVQAGNEKEILQAVTLNDANFMSEETRRISAYSISNSGHPGRAPTQQEDPQQGRKGKGGRHSSMMMSTQFPSIFFDMKHVSFNSESSSNGGSKQMHIPDALAKSDTFSRGSLDAGDGEDNGLDDFFDYSRGGEEDGAGEEDGKGDASASAADQASRTPATAANREPKPGNREGRATSERNSNMSLSPALAEPLVSRLTQ
eukprot:gene4834-5903_t